MIRKQESQRQDFSGGSNQPFRRPALLPVARQPARWLLMRCEEICKKQIEIASPLAQAPDCNLRLNLGCRLQSLPLV